MPHNTYCSEFRKDTVLRWSPLPSLSAPATSRNARRRCVRKSGTHSSLPTRPNGIRSPDSFPASSSTSLPNASAFAKGLCNWTSPTSSLPDSNNPPCAHPRPHLASPTRPALSDNCRSIAFAPKTHSAPCADFRITAFNWSLLHLPTTSGRNMRPNGASTNTSPT